MMLVVTPFVMLNSAWTLLAALPIHGHVAGLQMGPPLLRSGDGVASDRGQRPSSLHLEGIDLPAMSAALKIHREEREATSLVPLQVHPDRGHRQAPGRLPGGHLRAGGDPLRGQDPGAAGSLQGAAQRGPAQQCLAPAGPCGRSSPGAGSIRTWPGPIERLRPARRRCLRRPPGGPDPLPEPAVAGPGLPGHRAAHRGRLLQEGRPPPGARPVARRHRRASGHRLEARLGYLADYGPRRLGVYAHAGNRFSEIAELYGLL